MNCNNFGNTNANNCSNMMQGSRTRVKQKSRNSLGYPPIPQNNSIQQNNTNNTNTYSNNHSKSNKTPSGAIKQQQSGS